VKVHVDVLRVLDGMTKRPFPQSMNDAPLRVCGLEAAIAVEMEAVLVIDEQLDRWPTVTLDRIVASNESSAYFTATFRLVDP